jgi:hypothetical protein
VTWRENQEFAMLQRLMARWRLWEEALAGMDDPQGEYLLNLDERVRRLEAKVEQLRRPLPAVTPTSDPESE